MTACLIAQRPNYSHCQAISQLTCQSFRLHATYSLKHALHFPHHQLLQDGLLEWHSCLVSSLRHSADVIAE